MKRTAILRVYLILSLLLSNGVLGTGSTVKGKALFQPTCTISWISSVNGFWDVASNWNTNSVPGVSDNVCIDVAANVTVTYRQNTSSVNSVYSQEALLLTGGTLQVATTIQVNNTFTLNGGTLQGATILPGSAGQKLTVLSNVNSQVVGVTVAGEIELVAASAFLRIASGIVLNGSIRMSGTNSTLYLSVGSQTISGTGIIFFEGTTCCRYIVGNSTGTTTFGSGITLRGGAANIGAKPGLFGTATIVNQGMILADLPGQTIFIRANNSFVNQGSLQIAGGTLDVSKLSGTPGTVQFTSVGQLALDGTFSLDQPLSPPAGSALTLDGTYTVSQPLTMLAGSTLSLLGDWRNNSTINATTSTVNLGGQFTLADLGTFNRSGGTVNLVGTLENANTTLALNAATGNWQLNGGTILSGTVTSADGAKLTATNNFGNKLTGVSIEGELDLSTGSSFSRIENGMMINGTVRMAGVGSTLYFSEGDQTLSGNGTILFEGTTCCRYFAGNLSGTTFIGPGLTLRGGAASIGSKPGEFITVALVNQGTILADVPGQTIAIAPRNPFVNQGLLQVTVGAIAIKNSVAVDGSSQILVQPQGTLEVTGNLLGNTTDLTRFVPGGAVHLNGRKPVGNPQLLEVMGQDLGAVEAGFTNNFGYGSLYVEDSTTVMLVDQANNSANTGPEAIYADLVNVGAGSTLNLAGLHLYARRVLVAGSIIGGEISQFSQNGPITFGAVMSGTISSPGELDEWTFSGPAGRSVSIWVNPGSSGTPAPGLPRLTWAQVSLIGPGGIILASNSNSQSGAQINLSDIILPFTGDYRIRVRAPAAHASSTGNYLVRLLDSRFDEGILQLNQQVNGRIESANSVDRWRFSAISGQQIRFNLINRSSPGIVFRLTGPNGSTLFDNLASNSELISLVTSGSYLLTAYTSGGQTGDYAFRLSETSQTLLTLGVPYTGTLVGSGQAQLFRVDITQASPLSVRLVNGAVLNHIDLYAKLGAPPTRSDYGYRSQPQETNPQVLVPMAAPGIWYILLYGETAPASSGYQLLAETRAVFVSEVTPARAGASADTLLTVAGAGFADVATVELIGGDGVAHPTTGLEVYSPVQLTARVTASSAPPGVYSVRVTKMDGATGQLPQSFTIIPGGVPKFETNLVVPGFVGLALSTLYVEYANRGDVAMPAPVLVLHSSEQALFTLDGSRVIQGFATSAVPDGFSGTIQILAGGADPGILQPGEAFRVPVYYVGMQKPVHISAPWIDFDLTVSTANNPTPVDWASLKEQTRPDYVDLATWEAIWANFVAQVGPTWSDYIRMLSDNASYLGRLDQREVDVSQLFGFELQQANGLQPLPTLGSTVDTSVPTPGLNLGFGRVFPNSITGRNLSGPLGKGWYHFWQGSLTAQPDGTFYITGPDGSQRRFQPDARKPRRYFSAAGDQAELTKMADGSFDLREKNGVIRRYRSDGKFDSVVDTNGNRITAGYTGDRLTALTHSSGQSLLIAYNGAGRIVTVTDSKGRVIHYTYDGANEHLVAVQDYDGRITRYSYNTSSDLAVKHALLSIDAPSDVHRFYSYDSQGRLTSTFLNAGAERLDFTYGSAGTVNVTDAAGATTKLLFDRRGLLVQTVDPLGDVTRMEYDAAFNLIRLTDATGLIQRHTYDAQRNLLGHTDSLGQTTQFAYARPFSNLTVVVDAKNNPTRYVYDSQGNPIATTYADASAEHLTYDGLGEPLVSTNRRGATITYSHNGDGQITQKLYAGGGQAQYTYDARGNLASTIDAHGVTTYTYDAGDRLTRVSYPGGRFLAYTYDASGRRIRMADQTGFTVRYGYDVLGRLASMTDTAGSPIVAYGYDALGRLNRSDLGNGGFATYEYDVAGQLLHLINHAPGGGINSRFDYTYDALGRRTGMATLDGVWRYTYDATGQLTHALLDSTNPAIADQDLTYEYDALGNRVRTLENGVQTAYATNNMNQYTQVGTATYTYDADGNLTSRQGGSDPSIYTFDHDNHLVGLSTAAGDWAYEYDALGQRVASTHGGQRTEYLLDPTGLGNVVAEYDGAGNVVARYVHGLGLAARIDQTGTVYYDFDALGSTVGLTGPDGSYVNLYSYLPFGERLSASEAVSNPFAYVGRFGVMREGNGLNFMRARYYATFEGRFINQDPIGFGSGQTNIYGYVGNDPLRGLDPTGLFNWFEACKWGAAGGTCAAACLFGGPITCVGVCIGSGVLAGGLEKQDFECNEPPVPDPPVCPKSQCHFPDPPPKKPPFPPCLLEPDACGDDGRSGLVRGADPNVKTGPAGYGPQGFIGPDHSFTYRVEFENEAKATAPTQRVDIFDQLDPDLDWSTLEFTSFGFGDTFVAVPPGNQYYRTTVSMVQDDREFLVEVELGVYLDSGEIYVSYQSLDAATSLPPDVLTGFLPPEDGSGRGQGHFAYTIQPSASVTTGTEIRNVALIRFDFAEIIATNQVDPHDPNKGVDPTKEALNTIDATPPSSRVQPLPATSPSTFAVNWGGDDGAGSGIATYDVYVSDNGGAFVLWQTAISTTVANFTGVDTHTYAFYSVATDNVGYRQSTPSAAQATTTVSLIVIAPVLSITPSGADILLTWTSEPINQSYAVHRSVTPFFTPDATTLLTTLVSGSTVYTDVAAAGNLTSNYFYIVRAISGGQPADSNPVGKIAYALNNAGGKYSLIAVPFASTTIFNASSLASHIGNVGALLKWNPATQSFRFFVPPTSGDNFPVVQGDAIFVLVNSGGPSVVTLVGNVTAIQQNLTPGGFNFISLPLQKANLTNAAAVAADMTGVQALLSWNEATQLFRFFTPPNSGDNFAVQPGSPLIVSLASGAPSLWSATEAAVLGVIDYEPSLVIDVTPITPGRNEQDSELEAVRSTIFLPFIAGE